MGKTIKASDEAIVAALMSNGTVKGAAAVVGLTERALYDRMSGGAFKAMYMAAKADVLREATASLNAEIAEAVKTTAEIMRDAAVNPAIRLQAASTLLSNAVKFAERLSIEEQRVSAQRERNSFDVFDF